MMVLIKGARDTFRRLINILEEPTNFPSPPFFILNRKKAATTAVCFWDEDWDLLESRSN